MRVEDKILVMLCKNELNVIKAIKEETFDWLYFIRQAVSHDVAGLLHPAFFEDYSIPRWVRNIIDSIYNNQKNLGNLMIEEFHNIVFEIQRENIDVINQNNLKYIDFMRVNLGESAGEYLPDMRIPQSSCCYKLARVIVTNDLDVKSMISEVSQAGFDGIQFVKNHKLDVTAILPQSVSQALSNARDSVQKTDVFIESDTIHLNQPLFQMKKCNQGMCLSSLLRVSIENDALLQCPYEMRDLSIPIKEVNSFLEKRSLIDSCEKNCKDCGYISDNVIFENIYFASKNYFE